MAHDIFTGRYVAKDVSCGIGDEVLEGDMLSPSASAAITVDRAAQGDAGSKSSILAWRDKGDAGDARMRDLWTAGTEYASRRYGKTLDEICDSEDVVDPLPVAPKPPSSGAPRQKIWSEQPNDSSGGRDDKMVEALGDKWRG